MKKVIMCVMIAATALVSGCTKPDHSRQVLNGMGYKNINITGYRIWGCPDHDHFHTGFTAVGQIGQNVSGVVCSGWIVGSVVRFD